MKAVQIIGRKNSGKTTLVCELVRELSTRGVKVGTIKHSSHEHELDSPGKDSFLHRESGACPATIITPKLWGVYQIAEPGMDNTASLEFWYRNCDVVLIEGHLDGKWPTIEVWRREIETAPLILEEKNILALVSDDPVSGEFKKIPRKNLSSLADFVVGLGCSFQENPSLSSDPENAFRMANVSQKAATLRSAEARGRIGMSEQAFNLVCERRLPKGDALALAEMAGVMTAKKTSDLIPLCHPLPLEHISVRCELIPSQCSVLVHCHATTTGKTGVEMEALSGVSGALLTIYDLVKPVDPSPFISDIRLEFKEGGKKGRWIRPDSISKTTARPAAMLQRPKSLHHTLKLDVSSSSRDATNVEMCSTEPQPAFSENLSGVHVGILTVSDRASRGETEDLSGAVLREGIQSLGAVVVAKGLVADEISQIVEKISEYITVYKTPLIFTTGGTGLGKRDNTCQALESLAQRELPGFGEILRKEGASRNPFAWLSGSAGYLVQGSLVIALPGSPRAVREGLSIIAPLLPHALSMMRGEGHNRI